MTLLDDTADAPTADAPATGLAQEIVTGVATDEAFAKMIARLNKLSLARSYDAYTDVAWDDPDFSPAAHRDLLRLPALDPLAHTDWYRNLPDDAKAEVALYRLAVAMKVGWHFENVLQRGLLAYAMRLPNGVPEFRYAYHEIIEESQHTLMFQEFVARSGLPVRGMPRLARFFFANAALRASQHYHCLFFLGVLGGEDPIDHVQRTMLRDASEEYPVHPLAERIMRIHITEEARHISFARHTLKRDVPRLGRFQRFALSIAAPIGLGMLSRLMLDVPSDMGRHCDIPESVRREVNRSSASKRLRADSVAKTRALCDELGLMNPLSRRIWSAFGIA